MNHHPYIRTARRWKIPAELALKVLERDLSCIYCGRAFGNAPGERTGLRSWEHIVNDMSIVDEMNIALCCCGCNSSKGTKSLEKWLESSYCKHRNIGLGSMAPVAANALGSSKGAALSAVRAGVHSVPSSPVPQKFSEGRA